MANPQECQLRTMALIRLLLYQTGEYPGEFLVDMDSLSEA